MTFGVKLLNNLILNSKIVQPGLESILSGITSICEKSGFSFSLVETAIILITAFFIIYT